MKTIGIRHRHYINKHEDFIYLTKENTNKVLSQISETIQVLMRS